ncbi:hypothetical protein [Sphingosinithalassobacter portus]|uniref:hypothetical protein n=1 Tax=Stakelama portus TaxID=2676234 RepID=UPI000D6E65FE|nr:hypothetical protein [Sphingosinithalassobacter portus]
MTAGWMALLLLTMKLFPDVPVVRAIHDSLIVKPLAWLDSLERRHMLFALVFIGIALGGFEMIAVLGSADVAALLAWDISLYLDTVIAVWTMSTIGKARGAAAYLRSRIAGLLSRRPSARTRKRRARVAAARKPANDSDADGGWAWAA